MPTKIIEERKYDRLSKEKEAYFLLGYTWEGPEYPFESEDQRKKLWLKYQDKIMDIVYENREGRYAADKNQLRPNEWFRDREPKKVFNNAQIVKIDSQTGHELWDMSPYEESDLEYLKRLDLLNEKDLRRIESEEFKMAETEAIEFREYMVEEDEKEKKFKYRSNWG